MTLRERSTLTMHEIATAASYRGRSSVQKFFSPEYDPPALDMIVAGRLARALVGRGTPPIEEDEIFSLTASKRNELERYNFKSMPGLLRDIPIYSATYAYSKSLKSAGGNTVSMYMLDLDNPLRFAWHPPCYEGRSGIYAILVFGQPLTPRFKPGETLFIDAAEPAKLGDDVCAHILEFDSQDIFDNSDRSSSMPEAAVIAIFGTYERQEGDRVYIRSFDGLTLTQLSLARLKDITRLLTLADALVP